MDNIKKIQKLLDDYIDESKKLRNTYEEKIALKDMYDELLLLLNGDYDEMNDNKLMISILFNSIYKNDIYETTFYHILNKLQIDKENKSEINKFIRVIKNDCRELEQAIEDIKNQIGKDKFSYESFEPSTEMFDAVKNFAENDLKEVMREVKLALLEADVNYKIVKDFIVDVEKKALGQDVLKSLTPGQQVVKIVRDEMTELLGGVASKINFTPNPPTIIMLVGLQGSGKTTTCGKLANLLRKQGKKPLLVACDVYRPAAIKQLQVVGKSLNIPVYANENSKDVVRIAKQAISEAYSKLNDVIILDTAGRLHIDEELMQELKNVKTNVKPHEILLVVDSMTGQDAVNVAKTFNEKLVIDGVILTKLDGDTRGGAALSVKKITGKPIKFAANRRKTK